MTPSVAFSAAMPLTTTSFSYGYFYAASFDPDRFSHY
jgi:hypothetical protein